MNRARQMPNSTEQESSSDDLIAELARLMAEEAQGDRKDAPAAKEPEPQPLPVSEQRAAEPAHKLPEGGNVVRIPGARPASPSSAPEGSIWGRTAEAPSAANSDDRPAFTDDNPFLVEQEQASVATSAPEPASETHVAPAPSAPAAHHEPDDMPSKPLFSSMQPQSETRPDPLIAGAAEPDFLPDPPMPPESAANADANPFDTGSAAFDPIAELIAEQEHDDASSAAPMFETQPERQEPPPFEAPLEPAQPAAPPQAAPTSAFAMRRAPEPTSEPQPEPEPEPQAPVSTAPEQAKSDLDDDVLSLLRAMNEAQAAPAAAPEPAAGPDAFASAPIFGLNTTKQADAASSDPLDEIESLIGDAVRLSQDKHPQAAATPEVEPSFDDAALAAEAAIAAATAETTRSVRAPQARPAPAPEPEFTPRFDSVDPVETPKAEDATKPAKPNNRLIVAGAAAATLLVAVAFGLFFMFGTPAEQPGAIPVIASNTADAKETVEPTTANADTTQPAIFTEPETSTDAAAVDEQIVSRDQSTTVAEDVRQVATAETAEEGLANRKVRTVTVRPDGSIVSSDDTVAASEILPVTRPDVPLLSSVANGAEDFQVATTPAGTEAPVAAPTQSVADPLASIVETATSEAGNSTGELVANAPFPAPLPADLAARTAAVTASNTAAQVTTAPATTTNGTMGDTIDLIADTANQVAASLPTATAPATTTPVTETVPGVAANATSVASAATSGPDAPAYVQLSSQRNLDAANVTLASMAQRYKGLFNGASAFVRRVDLGDRGIYYRVLVPASSSADANGVCASVKAAGGDCFVRNN